MGKQKFSDSFRHKTVDRDDRIKYYNNNSNNLSFNNNEVVYFPYNILKDAPFKKFNFKNKSELINYYIFNHTYKSIILKYILLVETSLKESISYVIGIKYGDFTHKTSKDVNQPNDYLNIKHYRSYDIESVKSTLTSLKNLIVNPAIYCDNIKKYQSESNIPPYILANDLMFRWAIDWYYIMKDDDKDDVIEIMLHGNNNFNKKHLNRDFFILSLRLFNEMRNNFAHNGESEYDPNNYSQPTYDTVKNLLNMIPFNESITKAGYKKYLKKSPTSIGLIFLLIYLDDNTKIKLLEDIFSLFENSSKHYCLDKSTLIEDLDIKNFYNLLENLLLHYLELQDEMSKQY